MNAAQSNLQLDDNWAMTVLDEIEAVYETLADVADPYTVGWVVAEQGWPCEPLLHYARLGEIEQFIIGWKDCMIAMADTEDYADDVAEREFIRFGGA